MKKLLLSVVLLVTSSLSLFAQHSEGDTLKQFILIVRYNPNIQKPSKVAIADNVQHWNTFMGELGRNGKIVAGYRPSPDGEIITNKAKTDGAYYSNNESISSIIIIKAGSQDAAEAIAKKCPILEFDGSIEVRPLLMTN